MKGIPKYVAAGLLAGGLLLVAYELGYERGSQRPPDPYATYGGSVADPDALAKQLGGTVSSPVEGLPPGAVVTPIQHKYRFERDGASLWRYDETTGEACQLESNVRDNWIGGHCPVQLDFSRAQPITPTAPAEHGPWEDYKPPPLPPGATPLPPGYSETPISPQ